MAVNVIGQRMNFMVILHGCWLVAILTRRRRRAIARLWPNYCLFLTLFLLYQYLLCLGIPPALCIGEQGMGCGQGVGHAYSVRCVCGCGLMGMHRGVSHTPWALPVLELASAPSPFHSLAS